MARTLFSNEEEQKDLQNLEGGNKKLTDEEIVELGRTVTNLVADLKEQKSYVFYGFIVLVFTVLFAICGLTFTVGSILHDSWTNKNASYDELQSRIDSLKEVEKQPPIITNPPPK